MNVYIKEMPAAPVVAINVWVHVGSRNEKAGEEGFSHFIEHMLFKGTPTYPTGQLDREIKKLGASQNAFTSLDYTCFHLLGAKEHFPRLLELELDAVFHSLIDNNEFQKERQVVLEELRMDKDDPPSYLYNAMKELTYTIHPYRHPVVGYEATLASASRDGLFDFYRRYYVPENIWLVVVGDVKADEALSLIRRLTGSEKKSVFPEQNVAEEPIQTSKREAVLFGEIEQAYVNLAWHAPGILNPDNYSMDVISFILGNGRSSRLHKTLVEEEQLVSSVSSNYFTSGDPSLFFIGAVMPQGNVRKFIDRASRLVREFRDGEIPSEELEKAKQQIISSTIFSRETAQSQAFSYGHYATLGKLEEADLYLDRIQALSRDDIIRVAKSVFQDAGLSVIRYEPKVATVSSKPEMITLENGLRLIVKENHSSPIIAISVQIDAGGLREEKNEAGLANLTAKTLLKGTKRMSSEEIAKTLESMGTTLSINAQKSFATLKMQCLTEKFFPSLEVVLEVLVNSDFPEVEFKKEQEIALEAIKTESDDLFSFTFYNTLSRLFPDFPLGYSNLGISEKVRSLKRSDVSQFHKKHFLGSGMVVSIVGDFYLNESKKKFSELFSRIPTGTHVELKDPKFHSIAQPIEIEGKKNKEQVQIMVATRTFPKADPQTPALHLLKNILSGSMSSRLFTNLRDKDSLAYSVWASTLEGKNSGFFYATLSSAVNKLDSAKTRLIEELEKIRKEGFTDEELSDSKKYVLGQYALSQVDNLSQSEVFSSDEFMGLGYDYFEKYPNLIRSTTKEEVSSICQQFLLGSGSYVLGLTKP
ncbi:insulinase family protein [bacterium]|nr:insulinase family protein [bacterium]